MRGKHTLIIADISGITRIEEDERPPVYENARKPVHGFSDGEPRLKSHCDTCRNHCGANWNEPLLWRRAWYWHRYTRIIIVTLQHSH